MPTPIATIDTEALRHNYRWLKTVHGDKLLAVVKSDAYGHGLIRCAEALADIADGFAVMFLEEALALREAGIRNPILLIEGLFQADELAIASQHNLWIVVQNEAQLHQLLSTPLPLPATVWLKMDSGLHRGGIAPNDYADAYQILAHHANIHEVTKMTHFSCADEWDNPLTETQMGVFNTICAHLPLGKISVANSGALLKPPHAKLGWGRAGLALYGISPFPTHTFEALKPVMTLATTLLSIHRIDAGERIGYGATFTTGRPTKIALVAGGYADGYPRLAPSGTPVMVNHHICPLIGRVSMNLMTVDITAIPLPAINDTVELWGSNITVGTVAESAGTDPRELLTQVQHLKHVSKKIGDAMG